MNLSLVLMVIVCSDIGKSSVILHAQVIKSTQRTDDVRMIKCMCNQLEFHRFPLEYLLHRLGLYCSFGVSLIDFLRC